MNINIHDIFGQFIHIGQHFIDIVSRDLVAPFDKRVADIPVDILGKMDGVHIIIKIRDDLKIILVVIDMSVVVLYQLFYAYPFGRQNCVTLSVPVCVVPPAHGIWREKELKLSLRMVGDHIGDKFGILNRKLIIHMLILHGRNLRKTLIHLHAHQMMESLPLRPVV